MNGQKEKAALQQQTRPCEMNHETIIADMELVCQTEHLRETIEGKISPKAIVEILKPIYRSFDKSMLSKCMNSSRYGVVLHRRGMEALIDAFPELHTNGPQDAPKQHKSGKHKFTCRVQARLPDEQYSELQQFIRADGYGTMQDWISEQVRKYLKRKRREQLKRRQSK